MDTELLKTFLEVNKTRHFAKAANNLHVTQAAVSARIRQLEEQLGVSLFLRSRNRTQLTAAGEQLIPHAETMLLAWARARQDVSLKEHARDHIAIGASNGLWHFYLQDQLQHMHEHIPDLAFSALSESDLELRKRVMEGTLDIALLYEPPRTSRLRIESLGKLRLVLASSNGDKPVSEALRDDYILVDWGTQFNNFHAKNFPEIEPPLLRTNMAPVAESFILGNGGSAYLPQQRLTLHQGLMYQIDGAPYFERDMYLMYHPKNEKLSTIQKVIKHISPLH